MTRFLFSCISRSYREKNHWSLKFKSYIMEAIITEQDLEYEIRKIENTHIKRALFLNESVQLCRRILHEYRAKIIQGGFEDKNSEIRFFKEEKQVPLSYLIFYSMLQSFELKAPQKHTKGYRAFVDKRVVKINRILLKHQDFVHYMELEQTHLDHYYFTRKYNGTNVSTTSRCFLIDPEFNTSFDLVLGKLKANKMLLAYLMDKTDRYIIKNKVLEWTSSKIYLTELVFALFHAGVFNHGKASINEIVQWVENSTGCDLGDYHHTSVRFRNRSNPTKFMDELKRKLLIWVHSLDA